SAGPRPWRAPRRGGRRGGRDSDVWAAGRWQAWRSPESAESWGQDATLRLPLHMTAQGRTDSRKPPNRACGFSTAQCVRGGWRAADGAVAGGEAGERALRLGLAGEDADHVLGTGGREPLRVGAA